MGNWSHHFVIAPRPFPFNKWPSLGMNCLLTQARMFAPRLSSSAMNFLMSSFLFALQMCVGSHSSVLAMLTEIRMCTLSYVSPSVTTCFWALIKYDSKPYKIMCGYVFVSCCGRVRMFLAHRSLQSRPCNRVLAIVARKRFSHVWPWLIISSRLFGKQWQQLWNWNTVLVLESYPSTGKPLIHRSPPWPHNAL